MQCAKMDENAEHAIDAPRHYQSDFSIAIVYGMFNCIKSNKKTILRLSFVLGSPDFYFSCHLCLKASLEIKVDSIEEKDIK